MGGAGPRTDWGLKDDIWVGGKPGSFTWFRTDILKERVCQVTPKSQAPHPQEEVSRAGAFSFHRRETPLLSLKTTREASPTLWNGAG